MTSKFVIQGNRTLAGKVDISGSKNGALPCISACLLTQDKVCLRNIPDIADINALIEILKELNVEVIRRENILTIAANEPHNIIPSDLSSKLRGSTLLMGSLLARTGSIAISGIGGCDIGKRPIDFHLDAFRRLGASVKEESSTIHISADKLLGSRIEFPFPSVGATENALIACSFASGNSTIVNAAIEPEIISLIQMLQSMGADIHHMKDRILSIKGVENLYGCSHTIIPDRIEAGTFLVAGAINNNDITVESMNPSDISIIIEVLKKAGADISIVDKESVSIQGRDDLHAFEITTQPYPGFPSDLQPQFSVLATHANSSSRITETLYENRFTYVNELRRMGARIECIGNSIVIQGPCKLYGTRVKAMDLRGGAALVLAALSSAGSTEIEDIYHIDRGFEALESKLKELGADIERT